MACYNPFRLLSSMNFSNNCVLMEHYGGQQLEDAVNCLHKFTSLKEDNTGADTKTPPLFESQNLGKMNVIYLLKEMQQAISGVKEMKQRVRNREDNNINVTREVFATLHKAIDEREEQTIADIKERAYRRERALELQLERLVLLWTQLKNCLNLMKNTKMKSEELTRMILKQRIDYLKDMKEKSDLEPVVGVQDEPEFESIEQLCQAISMLGFTPLDLNKCEVVIPPAMVNEKTTLMIVLRNKCNKPVTGASKELNVFIESVRDKETIQVRKIKEVDGGRYETSFTASRCGYYKISIIVNGHHIPGSPNKITVDRDYRKITEQNCSQAMTHYGGNEFGYLYDVTIAPTGEVIVLDDKHIIVLDDKLNSLKVIGQESNDQEFCPFGVAVINNIIAVSFQRTDQVKKYSLQGDCLSEFGSHGNKNGQFSEPRGLAFNNNELLYVVDGCNHRIQVFNKGNVFVFSFGCEGNNPGQFQWPARISIDPNNNVLVTDRDANCIHLFTHDGQFTQTINSHRPYAITFTPAGYLITGHSGDDNKIRVWSPTYQLIHRFGKKGSKQGEFRSINGMAINTSGNIYVAEYDNNRLQVISNS